MTINVMYSCTLCALIDASVTVPARESETKPVVEWVEETIKLIAADHARRSPLCRPKQLHNLKIPIEGAEWVGGPPIQ